MTPRCVGTGGFALLTLLAASARAQDDAPAESSEASEASEDEPARETVVVGRRSREVVSADVSAAELQSTAASAGSPLRVVESLPGVARGPSLGGELVIRGSAPEDSRVLLDGFAIPTLYHVGGLTSVVRADLLESIRFVPGNFTVRQGRATGGVVEVWTRRPARKLHLELEAGFLDAGLLADAPIGSRAGLTLAVRRSFLDRFVDGVVSSRQMPFFAVPTYWDYELGGAVRLSARDSLRANVIGAGDAVGLAVSTPSADPRVRGSYRSDGDFHRGVVLWKHHGRRFEHALGVSAGTSAQSSSLGAIYDRQRTVHVLALRDELDVPVDAVWRLTAGLDLEADRVEPDLSGLPPALTDENALPALDADQRVTEPRWIARPAAFVETRLRPFSILVLTTGVRADHDSDVGRAILQPRASAKVRVGPDTTLRAGFGVYAQAPDLDETDPTLGRPGLGFEKALHLGLGVDRRFGPRVSLEVDGFYKSLWDLVVRRDAVAEVLGELANDGVGRVAGATVLLRRLPGDGPHGWVSYTLMRSERRAPGEPYRPFDFDQTHILTVVASWPFADGWQVGARFRLVSGNPETPLLGPDRFDSDSALYVPRIGAQNSERLPLFHQLDLRIAKRWQLEGCALSAYLDVQNVYDRRNTEGFEYRYDYRQRVRVSGLPLLPLLGATGEF